MACMTLSLPMRAPAKTTELDAAGMRNWALNQGV